MYYGKGDAALHYRICVINRSPTDKAVNVQVMLGELEPPELPCAPCFMRLMNDIRKDEDPTPFKESFDLKPLHSQFIDLLAQDPNWNEAKFWCHHVVRQISPLIPKQQYTFVISASSDNVTPDRKRFTLFKNGPYWQLREAPLA
jgi:hypothetical protein